MDITIVEHFQSIQNVFLDNIFCFVSKFGEAISFVVMFYFLYWCFNRKSAVSFLCIYLSGMALNVGLKHAFKRPRPFQISANVSDKYGSVGYSFPSGHSASATLVFGGQWMQTKKHSCKGVKILNIVINCLIILNVMLSRIYLGQHYLSDVICGCLFAILWLIFGKRIYNFFGANDHKALLLVVPVALMVALFASNPFTVNFEVSKIYIVCGLLSGVILGYYIDRKFIKLPTIINFKYTLIKLIVGLLITSMCLLILLSLSEYLIVCLIGYCIFGIISTAGCSAIFQKIYKKMFIKEKKYENV